MLFTLICLNSYPDGGINWLLGCAERGRPGWSGVRPLRSAAALRLDCHLQRPTRRPDRTARDVSFNLRSSEESRARTRLPAGGRWLRTIGPAAKKDRRVRFRGRLKEMIKNRRRQRRTARGRASPDPGHRAAVELPGRAATDPLARRDCPIAAAPRLATAGALLTARGASKPIPTPFRSD
jgi:hypothetical protein